MYPLTSHLLDQSLDKSLQEYRSYLWKGKPGKFGFTVCNCHCDLVFLFICFGVFCEVFVFCCFYF